MMSSANEGRVRPGATVAVRIEALGNDGRGIGHIDGREAAVRGAWPGDLVEARIYKKRRGLFEAYTVAVLDEGVPRRTPPCRHVGECGGCRWQQWSVGLQRDAKRRIVERLIRDALGDDAPEVLPTREVGPEFGYRNKMEFTFGRRDDGSITLGLHRAGSFLATFDVERCWIAPPVMSDVVAWVRRWAGRHGLSSYNKRTGEGLLRYLVVRSAAATGQIMVNLVATRGEFAGLEELRAELPVAVPSVTSLLLSINTRKGDTAIPESVALIAGRETITERIGPFAVDISARSFLQTNSKGAEALYETVREKGGLTGSERVLDLYCGAGLIGLWLADAAREVLGVEHVPDAVADAERLCRRAGRENVRLVVGSAEKVLPDWAERGESFDVAIVDPPRPGLHPKALKALVRLRPARIVYVSCNPSALARDMKALGEAGYVAGPVQPVDMFPQTAHVESVVRLDRR